MKLKNLLADTGIACPEPMKDLDITGLTYDSRRIKKGNLFVCLKGSHTDGHIYALDAAFGGAAVLLCEEPLPSQPPVPTLFVSDAKKALARLSKNYYGDPSSTMTVFGITGTNGKTTVTYMIKSILEAAQIECGVIGTVAYRYADREYEARQTTPESLELQRFFFEMREQNIHHCAMEVSSHGLALDRVEDVSFAFTAFTNLTGDHLDFHGSMEAYYRAKKKLFLMKQQAALINRDDAYGRRLLSELIAEQREAHSFSLLDEKADFYGKIIENGMEGCGMDFFHRGTLLGRISLKTPGVFTLYNGLTASGLALLSGVPFAAVKAGLEDMEGVPGRFEPVENSQGVKVFVDYAHTPDALRLALETAGKIKENKLICLFGCGGDRDKSKRPLMGELAGTLADLCVITSDNPRNESQEAIEKEILLGLLKTDCPYRVIESRKQAIFWALSQYEKGDVLLIAGKGHECYQIIGGAKNYFSDQEAVKKALARMQMMREAKSNESLAGALSNAQGDS